MDAKEAAAAARDLLVGYEPAEPAALADALCELWLRAAPSAAPELEEGEKNLMRSLGIRDPHYRSVGVPVAVLNALGKEIGKVLTCVTDMAIGRHEGRIYSVATPDKPEGLKIKGLCCGFIKVKTKLSPGDTVELKDAKRQVKVRIETDIRPDRSARKALKNFK